MGAFQAAAILAISGENLKPRPAHVSCLPWRTRMDKTPLVVAEVELDSSHIRSAGTAVDERDPDFSSGDGPVQVTKEDHSHGRLLER
jgi:hypothetical protein